MLRGYATIAVMTLCTASAIMCFGGLGSAPARAIADIGADIDTFTDLNSIGAWLQVVSTVVCAGEVINLFNRPWLSATLLVIICTVNWPITMTFDHGYLYLRQIVTCALSGPLVPILTSMAASLYEPESVATAGGLISAGYGIGQSLSVLVEGRLASRWKWYGLIGSVLAALSAVLLVMIVPERRRRNMPSHSPTEVIVSVLKSYRLTAYAILTIPSLAIFCVASFCTPVVIGINAFLQQYLVIEQGVASQEATDLAGGLGIASLLAFLPIGLLIDYVAERRHVSRYFSACGFQLIATCCVLGMLAAAGSPRHLLSELAQQTFHPDAPAPSRYDSKFVFWLCYLFGVALGTLPWGVATIQLVRSTPAELRASFIAVGQAFFSLGIACSVKVEGSVLASLQTQQGIDNPYNRIFTGNACVMAVAVPCYFALALLERRDSVAIAALEQHITSPSLAPEHDVTEAGPLKGLQAVRTDQRPTLYGT